MSDGERKTGGESMWAHEPLPYVVRLRVTASDDAVPMVVEHRCVAYSTFEAVMQALMVTSGRPSAEESNIRVESVAPDVARWLADQMVARVALARGAGKEA